MYLHLSISIPIENSDSKGVGDYMILFSILLIGFLAHSFTYIIYMYIFVEFCWWKKFCTFLVKLRCSAAQRHCAPHWACYFWSWTPRGRKGVGKLWVWWSTWWVTRAKFPYSTGNGSMWSTILRRLIHWFQRGWTCNGIPSWVHRLGPASQSMARRLCYKPGILPVKRCTTTWLMCSLSHKALTEICSKIHAIVHSKGKMA